MPKLTKGLLFVFEGIDGGGKTTQAKQLQALLEAEEFEVIYFREPSDSRWGQLIREKASKEDSLTPEEELDLFVKDRKENITHNLRPALLQKKVVILDRYYFSTIAYQGAKGIDPEVIREIHASFVVVPDLVFILDVKADLGLERIEDRGQRDLLFEREDYLKKVRELFQSFHGEQIFHIDAMRPPEEVGVDISQIAQDYIRFFVE